jgi:hypothetical protein
MHFESVFYAVARRILHHTSHCIDMGIDTQAPS